MHVLLPLLVALNLLALPASAEEFATSWNVGLKSRARMISAGQNASGQYLAGFEIELSPATLTYWRNPGEAGIPPVLSSEGSQNLQSIEMRFPAPKILSEGGVVAFGYENGVTFPLVITAQDITKPVTVKYVLDYAVCEKICVPAKTSGTLVISASSGPYLEQIRMNLRKVPVPQKFGLEAPLALTQFRQISFAPKPVYELVARVPEEAVLFVEGPEGYYFSVKNAGLAQGAQTFQITLDEAPKQPAPAASLKFTLVTPHAAIETDQRLDAATIKP